MSLRSAKLSGTVYYLNGTTLFNGSLRIRLLPPGENGEGTIWPRLTVDQGYPTTEIPLWTTVPIKDGLYSQTEGLWWNSDIQPPNSTYVGYYVDSAGEPVSPVTAQFTASSTTVTPVTSINVNPTVPSVSREIPTLVEVV